MPDLDFVTCDVFTEKAFSGNPLAIVLDAAGLGDGQMQRLAREFNLSETIFVLPPVDPAHTAQVRIFFPDGEIPFAGHPTIGCAIHLALRHAPEGDFETEITLEEVAGLVPVQVSRKAGRIEATLTAPVVPCAGTGTLPSPELAASALTLAAEQIGFAGHGIGLWQGGPQFLYIPVKDLGALAQAKPCEPAWSEAMERASVDSMYLYTPGTDCDFRARMFSPTAGIPEDPATGSATAILAAQLLASDALRDGENRFTLHQGVEMGRPSTLGLTIDVQDKTLEAVRITGSAIAISAGRVKRPA